MDSGKKSSSLFVAQEEKITRSIYSNLSIVVGLIPCRTVATDIEDGTRVTIASGALDDAIRSSASVPLVWSPVKYGDRILVDGAINDPVPAEVVREMGADICIAVNVVPP
jgi:NTE family protein